MSHYSYWSNAFAASSSDNGNGGLNQLSLRRSVSLSRIILKKEAIFLKQLATS